MMIHASNWRAILARAPLPMLALAASYGVYSFNRLFVPAWVALVSAAAFELTYVGLALMRTSDAAQRARARAISLGAVAVSVLYNTLAGLAHRAPDVFATMSRGAEVALALLHGAPLAIVAFLVADLLLHDSVATRARNDVATRAHNATRARNDVATRAPDAARAPDATRARNDVATRARALAALHAGVPLAQVARELQINPSTLRTWRARAARPAVAAD